MTPPECGCRVRAVGAKDWGLGPINDITEIVYCPMHQAAPALLRAAREVQKEWRDWPDEYPMWHTLNTMGEISKAVAQAEGGKDGVGTR